MFIVVLLRVDEHLPLRDAVEFRILDVEDEDAIEDVVNDVKTVIALQQNEFDSGESYNYRAPPSTIVHNRYGAYSFPTQYDTKNPQPFRYGSPYQQLVDISTLDKLPVVEYNQLQPVSHLKQVRDDYKVVCHMTNWAYYRHDKAQFVPEHIDNRLCTHIVYSFATLDPASLLMKEFDPWADIENSE